MVLDNSISQNRKAKLFKKINNLIPIQVNGPRIKGQEKVK